MGKKKAVNLKRSGNLTRLYGYSPGFLKELGQAFQMSRLNYFGIGEYIRLDDLEVAAGVSASVINSIELSNRVTAGMDNIVSLWIVLSHGQYPPINPRTGEPYRWLDFGELFEPDEQRLRQAATVRVQINKILKDFKSENPLEAMEPNRKLLQLIEAYCQQHELQASDEDAVVQHLSAKARVLPQSVRSLLRREATFAQLSPLEAKLLYSVLPPKADPWSFEDFVLYVTGWSLQSAAEHEASIPAEVFNGHPVA